MRLQRTFNSLAEKTKMGSDTEKANPELEPYRDEKTSSEDNAAALVRESLPNDAPAGYFPKSAEERKRARSVNLKLDVVLLPFLSILYLFNGLDRGNVGNAETQGISTHRRYIA